MTRRKKPAMGRPRLPLAEKATPLHLFLAPHRRAIAAAIGGTAAKGIYALLDFAAQNPAFAAKMTAIAAASSSARKKAV